MEVGMMKRYRSVSRSWIHETILCRINVGLQNLRTIEPSDYRPVTLQAWHPFKRDMVEKDLCRSIN